MIEDIYNRKPIGRDVYGAEGGEKATLIQRTVTLEKWPRQPLVCYSDNGAPMKSVALLSKIYDLGITPFALPTTVEQRQPLLGIALQNAQVLPAIAAGWIYEPR